jgi:hypothetical protein
VGGTLQAVTVHSEYQVQGLTGDATIYRPTYVFSRAACGQGFVPLDAELGLEAESHDFDLIYTKDR